MNALLFDSDSSFLQSLEELLQCECAEWVAGVETYHQPDPACEAVQQRLPDLVFLNAELSLRHDCPLLQKLNGSSAKLVFWGSNGEFALKAFAYQAVGFLLLPIQAEELRRIVAHCHEGLRLRQKLHRWESLGLNPHLDKDGHPTFSLHTDEGYVYLRVKDVVRLEAQGAYTRFFTEDGESVMVSKTLKDWQDFFRDYRFFRVHDSHLVNLGYVKKFLRKDGGHIVLRDKSSIPVSRRRKESLLAVLNNGGNEAPFHSSNL